VKLIWKRWKRCWKNSVIVDERREEEQAILKEQEQRQAKLKPSARNC
jgi:hypothetical protein